MVTDRSRDIDGSTGTIDNWCDDAGPDEPGQDLEMLGPRLDDETAHPLLHEPRDQRRTELSVEATKEVAVAALAHLDEHLVITDRWLVDFT